MVIGWFGCCGCFLVVDGVEGEGKGSRRTAGRTEGAMLWVWESVPCVWRMGRLWTMIGDFCHFVLECQVLECPGVGDEPLARFFSCRLTVGGGQAGPKS